MKKASILLITIFTFMASFIHIFAETISKDVTAKYEYKSSSFNVQLNGRDELILSDNFDVNITNENSDNNNNMVIIPIDNPNSTILGDYVLGSNDYEAYYIDFYNANNKQTNLVNPVIISSIRGKSYKKAFVYIISSSGEILDKIKIDNNDFSIRIDQKSYMLINYENFRKGDINHDEIVNINDLIMLRKHLANIKLLVGINLEAADINTVKLRKYLAGIEEL